MVDRPLSPTHPNSFPRFSHLKQYLGSSADNGDYELLLEGSTEYELDNSVASGTSIPLSPAGRSIGRGRKYGLGPIEYVKHTYGAVPLLPTPTPPPPSNNQNAGQPRQRK